MAFRLHITAWDCFGGAGGQHAVAVARDLGINRVIIPRYSSILPAYGMALADVTLEHQEPEAVTMSKEALPRLEVRFERLRAAGVQALVAQGFTEDQINHEMFLSMRYQGSDTALKTCNYHRLCPCFHTTTFTGVWFLATSRYHRRRCESVKCWPKRKRGVDEPFLRVRKDTFSSPGCPIPTRIQKASLLGA